MIKMPVEGRLLWIFMAGMILIAVSVLVSATAYLLWEQPPPWRAVTVIRITTLCLKTIGCILCCFACASMFITGRPDVGPVGRLAAVIGIIAFTMLMLIPVYPWY